MDNQPKSRLQQCQNSRDLPEDAGDAPKIAEAVESNESRDADKIKGDLEHPVARPMNELEQHVNDLDDSWETESMLAEMLEGLTDDTAHDGK